MGLRIGKPQRCGEGRSYGPCWSEQGLVSRLDRIENEWKVSAEK